MLGLFRGARARSVAHTRGPGKLRRGSSLGGVREGFDQGELPTATAVLPESEAGDGMPPVRPTGNQANGRPVDADMAALWDAIERLTATVETDHAARLGRIENDLKWVMRLMTAVLAALLGASAAGSLLGG